MELVSNLVAICGYPVGLLPERNPVSEKPKAGVFPADLLLWLLCPRLPVLDAVSVLIFKNTAGLLCVGVRLVGQRHIPLSSAIYPFFRRGKGACVPQSSDRRPDRCSAVCVLLYLWRYSLQSALVQYDDRCFLSFHPGAFLCADTNGNRAEYAIFPHGSAVLCCGGICPLDLRLPLAG